MTDLNPKHLILCPLKAEYKGLVAGLKGLVPVSELNLGHGPGAYLKDQETIVTVGGLGRAAMADSAKALLKRYQGSNGLESILCVGSAGTLREELSIGDIVCGQTPLDGQRSAPGDQPGRLKPYLDLPGCYEGSILSRDEVISKDAAVKALRNAYPNALAVAWEGFGVHEVAMAQGLEFLEVRVISDRCTEDSVYQGQAMISELMKKMAPALVSILKENQRRWAIPES